MNKFNLYCGYKNEVIPNRVSLNFYVSGNQDTMENNSIIAEIVFTDNDGIPHAFPLKEQDLRSLSRISDNILTLNEKFNDISYFNNAAI